VFFTGLPTNGQAIQGIVGGVSLPGAAGILHSANGM
jgi:hypothetical protein